MEVSGLQDTKHITILSNRKEVTLTVSSILYVLMKGNNAEIHTFGYKVYKTRMTMNELENTLGDGFLKVHRSCLVSVMAVHDITDKINLSNGESLDYVLRKKKEIIAQLHAKQKNMISSFSGDDIPAAEEKYHAHYSCFDALPVAFADIEMVVNEERRAVDWIFRYGNPALAKLEKIPLERLIGSSFGSLFSNMDAKWLRSYERAVLYGETLEIIDYSPEIDTYLRVICFPTFKGHCGCILFDVSEIKFTQSSSDTSEALLRYFGKLLEQNC